MVTQTITLQSREHYGSRIPSQALGCVLERIPDAVRLSVRMAVEGRSKARGKRPGWLRAAADIRFVGHDGDDSTVLHFDAPTLGEAAPRLYDQQQLWPTKPDSNDTGFDILADVLRDVASGNADSERFDRPLLDSLADFGKILNGTFTRMMVSSRATQRGQPVVVTPEVFEIAKGLYTNTPQPQRTRIVGKLDMLRASTQSFGLLLDDGQEVRGVLVDGDLESIRQSLNQRVVVVGRVVYRASGRALRIDAEAVTATADESRFFSSIPKPVRQQFDLRETMREQQHKAGIAAIIGKWPGDETDEEIRRALEELS